MNEFFMHVMIVAVCSSIILTAINTGKIVKYLKELRFILFVATKKDESEDEK